MNKEPDLILYGSGYRGYRSLQHIIDAVKAKFGEDCDFSQVEVETDQRQIACFGYDQYDPSDWEPIMNFTLTAID